MSAFDEFLSGAKRCFDYAAEKTGKAIDISKLQIEKSQLVCKLKEEYTALGKLCYAMSETGEDYSEKMKAKIINIHQLKEEIAILNSQLNSTRTTTCKGCGYTSETRFDYCPKCGEKM